MPSLKILVGSQNPVKVAAAKEIFTQYFPEHPLDCQGMHAPSGVPDQPLGEDDTRIGAENRVKHLIKHHQADFYCAMEGGANQFFKVERRFPSIDTENRRSTDKNVQSTINTN